MNKDTFNMVPTREAARATMSVLDKVQHMGRETGLVALSAAFLLAAERLGVPAQDAFTVAKNIMNHADGRRPEFAAVEAYMENEW